MYNLQGKKFGHLTVREMIPKEESYKYKPKNQRFWLCDCDCGNTTIVPSYCLISGNTKSCGCKNNARKHIDLIGKRFGSLTVIKQVDNIDKKSGRCWLCECDCGNKIIVNTQKLTGGHKKSCGCKYKGNTKNILGKRYGNLVVIKRIKSQNKANDITWLCKCDCGNQRIVTSSQLKNKRVTMCKECTKKHTKHPKGYKHSKPSHFLVDLSNKKFGMLTVINKATDTQIKAQHKRKNITYWNCLCECGNYCMVSASSLKKGQVSCGCQKSKGEVKIIKLLNENNTPYKYQYNLCRNPKTKHFLKADFFVNNQYVIEYDGEQHFSKVSWKYFTDNFKDRIERDKLKNQYCKDNNIPIIRIPYTRYDKLNIKDLILETSKFKQ